MARVAALGPHKERAARQMRATAALLDQDHPEMITGDHLRDAARVLEHGSTDGAKRHLDAAMELLTPRNLVRHGIKDDEGHALAKHHMHQVHRHRLNVQDIEDLRTRNDRLRAVARAARGLPEPGEPPEQAVAAANRPRRVIDLKASTAWMTERRGRGGKWTGSTLEQVLVPGLFTGQHPHSVGAAPGPGSVFGRHVSRGEAMGAMSVLGSMNAPRPGQLLAGQLEQRKSLSKGRRGIYDQLRGRGMDHYGAFLLASKGAAANLPKTRYRAPAPGSRTGQAIMSNVDLAGPEGYVHGWIKVEDAGHLHGTEVIGRDESGHHAVIGSYRHPGKVAPHGARQQPVAYVRKPSPEDRMMIARAAARQQRISQGLERAPGGLSNSSPALLFSARTAMLERGMTYAGGRCLPTTLVTSGSATGADQREITLALIAAARRGTGRSSTAGTGRAPRTTGRSVSLATTATTGWGTGRESGIARPGSPMHRYSPYGRAGQRARLLSAGSSGLPRRRSTQSSTAGAGTPSLELSARTAMLERTPAPRGRPGGPGLYHVKGLGHTAYMQQIVKALIEKRGMPPGKAYAIARGAIRKWMRGGGHVHPEVVAASARAESGELAKQARAHAHTAGWEVADALVELATTIDLFNPYHAPTGQFTTAQGAGQGKGKQQAARRDRKADRPQRAALVRKIAGIRAQLASLEAQLRAATSTRRPSTKRPGAKSKSATPAKKGAGKTSAAAARKGKTAATRVTPATLRGQIAALRATLQADLAQLRHL